MNRKAKGQFRLKRLNPSTFPVGRNRSDQKRSCASLSYFFTPVRAKDFTPVITELKGD